MDTNEQATTQHAGVAKTLHRPTAPCPGCEFSIPIWHLTAVPHGALKTVTFPRESFK